MFTINDDLSIYATRGDVVFFSVTAEDKEGNHKFQPGDILRFKVYGKKDAESVVLQKDFPVTEVTEKVDIYLTEQDTKIGEVISKPKDYWYEVELNPDTEPQTIIGYDEDGAKVFKLFPEGDDAEENEPDIKPEDIPVVDKELDLTSGRPVQNQAIARAVVKLEAAVKDNKTANEELSEQVAASDAAIRQEVSVERARLDNLLSGATADGAEVVDIRVGADGETYGSAGEAVREQGYRQNVNMQSINSAINRMMELDGEIVKPVLEKGFISLNVSSVDNLAYTASTTRIRTPKGYTIPLRVGDVVTLSDFTDAKFYLGIIGVDGSYISTGWKTEAYTVGRDCNALIVMAHKSEAAVSSVNELSDLLTIRRHKSIKTDMLSVWDCVGVSPNMEVGTLLNETGAEDGHDSRIRTVNTYHVDSVSGAKIDHTSFTFAVFEYDENMAYLKTNGWVDSFDKNSVSEACCYVRFIVRRRDYAEMTADMNTGFSLLLKSNSLYAGKRCSIYGDSISTYAGWNPDGNRVYYTGANAGVSNVHETWWKKTLDALGMELLVNNSWSGRCVSNARDAESDMIGSGGWIADNVAQLATENADPDVIIVKLGINDFNRAYKCKLGEYDGNQTFPDSAATFREAYAIMLKEIMTKFPLAEVWCCTLMQCEKTGDAGFPELNVQGETVTKWNRAIKELCDLFGAKVIDHNSCGITYFNMPTYMGDYDSATGDGLHPNANGHSLIANETIRTMDNGIRIRY